MDIIAFNGSPRKKGNTSILIDTVLEGASAAGANTTHVRIHDMNVKGCQACYACKDIEPCVCTLKDDLTPYLHAIKDSAGIVIGCPIYMFRVSGQIKLWVDRMYSYCKYTPKGKGHGYEPALDPGKYYAVVTSQGAPDPNQYGKSIRWLAGMGGYGMEEVGRVLHAGPVHASEDQKLLDQAREIGRMMVEKAG